MTNCFFLPSDTDVETPRLPSKNPYYVDVETTKSTKKDFILKSTKIKKQKMKQEQRKQ